MISSSCVVPESATLPVFTQPACTLSPLTDFDSAAFLSILLNYTVLTYLFALYCVQTPMVAQRRSITGATNTNCSDLRVCARVSQE